MIFRKVNESELQEVFSLYRSVVGTPFCVWDDAYPGWYDIREDFAHDTLYVMTEAGRIVGAISIIVHNELDGLDLWNERNAREIARVVVTPSRQGNGIAEQMVRKIAEILRGQGISAIHLLAAQANPPAQRVYRKVGFQLRGSCFMFGHDYLAFELLL